MIIILKSGIGDGEVEEVCRRITEMGYAPHVIRGLRNGLRLGQGQLEDTLWSALLDTHCGCTMAATADMASTRSRSSAARCQSGAGASRSRGGRAGGTVTR